MTHPESPEQPGGLDASLRTSLVAVGGFAAMSAVGVGAGWGLRAGISVLVGGALAVANLYGLARVLGGLVSGRTKADPNAGMWGVLAVFKVVGLFGGVWLLLGSHLVDPLSLVVGWAALPVGITVAALFRDKTDPPESRRGKQAPPGPDA